MDEREFAQRVTDIERLLYRVARGYLRQPQDCADAVQEAILKAWAARNSLCDPDHFKAWLTRILINECNSLLRRKRPFLAFRDLEDTPVPDDTGADLELQDALYSLNRRQRVVIIMHYRDGYTVEEIARVLRIPQGTVKTNLMRARNKLRQELRDEEVCLL